MPNNKNSVPNNKNSVLNYKNSVPNNKNYVPNNKNYVPNNKKAGPNNEKKIILAGKVPHKLRSCIFLWILLIDLTSLNTYGISDVCDGRSCK